MISQKMIANQLGLSRATVSRALRDDPNLRISDETRTRIMTFATEQGYTFKPKVNPSFHKILIIHKHSHFMSQIDNAYYFAIRNGIEETCHAKKLNFNYLTIAQVDHYEDNVNLVIIVGNHTEEDQRKILNHPFFKDVDFILIGKTNFFPNRINWISYCIKTATDLAISKTLNRTFDHYYYIGVQETYGFDKNQLELSRYVDGLQNNNLSFSAIQEGGFGTDGGYESMKTLANHNTLSNACILCANDPVAIGALQFMNDQKIAVPSDVAIVSINGDQNSQFIYPRLSTVDLKARVMGQEAIYLAQRILNHETQTICKIELQPDFLAGGSL